jgi:hypothetical protein
MFIFKDIYKSLKLLKIFKFNLFFFQTPTQARAKSNNIPDLKRRPEMKIAGKK